MAKYTDQQIQRLDVYISDIGLSVRNVNSLEESGILTVRDLLGKTRRELLSIANFGLKALDEVMSALNRLGFYEEGKEPTEEEKENPDEKRRRQIRESYNILD